MDRWIETQSLLFPKRKTTSCLSPIASPVKVLTPELKWVCIIQQDGQIQIYRLSWLTAQRHKRVRVEMKR